jgi:hypothetical protein
VVVTYNSLHINAQRKRAWLIGSTPTASIYSVGKWGR